MPNFLRVRSSLGAFVVPALFSVVLAPRAAIALYEVLPSPPIVTAPIHECAKSVHVTGFAAHNRVQVYSDSTLVGEDTPVFPFGDIALTAPLVLGAKISAVQIQVQDGIEYPSLNSLVPVTVTAFPGTPGKPKVDSTIYECGHVVPVGDLVQSTTVKAFAEGTQIGQEEAPETWKPVVTTALVVSQHVTATQSACGTTTSAPSDPVVVLSSPASVPVPQVVTAVRGTDAIMVTSLLTGALVQAYDGSTAIGGGYATAETNWVPLSITIAETSSITVTQQLCGGPTAGSPVAPVSTSIPTPELLAPIYAGQRYVLFRNVIPNASILIISANDQIGFGGGIPDADGTLVLALGRPAEAGEVIYGYEEFGSVSKASNSVTVSGTTAPLSLDLLEGEPFFNAETNDSEQQIDAPVFPRGRAAGPLVRVLGTECNLGARLDVTSPTSSTSTFNAPEQGFPGYFTTRLSWASLGNGTVPGGVPVGKYTVTATNLCDSTTTQKSFYVIFDPKEVDAPDRFGFNETGVWFGTGTYATRGLSYQLHPDDKRVFDIALSVASGKTDQYAAVQALLTHEEGMFGYSLDYHGHDVLHLLQSVTETQCADDANMLVALLRSVGIPSHPTTADAAVEEGPAGWNFDTWVEARVSGPSGLRWYAMHPHEQNPPTTRIAAGTGWGVATKDTNDIVVMANGDWVATELDDGVYDVRFHKDPNSSCHEPAEQFDYRASWVDHLCIYPSDDHYWNEGHWQCSPGTWSDLTISVLDSYWVGDTVHADVNVNNPSSTDKEGTLNVIIAVDNDMSKLFPDLQVDLGGVSISVPHGSNQTYSFTYNLPIGSSVAYHYSVVAKATYVSDHPADQNVGPFNVRALYDVALDLPANLHACAAGTDCLFDATLTITSQTSATLTDLSFALSLPFGVQTPSGGKEVALHEDQLLPGAVLVRTITLKIVEPDEAANFVVDVTTANGGTSQVSKTVTIETAGPTIVSVVPKAGGVPANQPPVAKCRDAWVTADTGCQGSVTASAIDNGSFDPDGPPPTCNLNSNGPFGLGSTPVLLTCVDNKGAHASCSATVTVVDSTPPYWVSTPPDVMASSCGGINIGTATAGDACGPSVGVTNNAPATYHLGTTTVTWTARDGSGNTTTYNQKVTVAGPPRFVSKPSDKSYTLCDVSPGIGTATAVDVCGTPVQVTNNAPPVFPVGTTTVRWTAVDAMGSTATYDQKITVTGGTDLGAEHHVSSVMNNACIQVTQYPGWAPYVHALIIQPQANGVGWPIPFTYKNCSNTGSGSLPAPWQQGTARPVSASCPTYIKLGGNGAGPVSLTWWANG